MISPPALVPSAHQASWLIDSLMNLTEPSAISTFTPPGWKLSRLANTEKLPEETLLQCVHWSCFELGTTIVVKPVETIPPWVHSRPRCRSVLDDDEFQALSHAWMPLRTAAWAVLASATRAAAGTAVTLIRPMFFDFGVCTEAPTTD